MPCPILAVVVNHTIDDAGPLVTYTSPPTCIGCGDGFITDSFDTSQLFNRTVTSYGGIPAQEASIQAVQAIEFNFTGIAIYIFVAAPSVVGVRVLVGPLAFSQSCSFVLDGATVGPSFFRNVSSPENGQYNILAYANTAIADGAHTFKSNYLHRAMASTLIIRYTRPSNEADSSLTATSSESTSSIVQTSSASSSLTSSSPALSSSTTRPRQAIPYIMKYKLNIDPKSSSSLLDSTSASTPTISELQASSDIASSTATAFSASSSAASSGTPSAPPPKAKPPLSLIIEITAGGAALIIAFVVWRCVHRKRGDSDEGWGELGEIEWPLFRSSSLTDTAPRSQADGLTGPYSIGRQQVPRILPTQPPHTGEHAGNGATTRRRSDSEEQRCVCPYIWAPWAAPAIVGAEHGTSSKPNA
ncbi:hypothetical protein MVEN_01725100 [Mycena venus]|uniref:Uncharacterized protein n=1 Tax=Mycena venus TaxID=2733690 RepID=A0A8H6XM51_9AGAR|nr:hypothetical protein MVEN_01725100 [Mycena venus]